MQNGCGFIMKDGKFYKGSTDRTKTVRHTEAAGTVIDNLEVNGIISNEFYMSDFLDDRFIQNAQQDLVREHRRVSKEFACFKQNVHNFKIEAENQHKFLPNRRMLFKEEELEN